ncbi:MAG: hypothetical protein GY826_08960, partial [Fuerstiella sp.]|nr:hypothetical protein [Fuerstiella sp.]
MFRSRNVPVIAWNLTVSRVLCPSALHIRVLFKSSDRFSGRIRLLPSVQAVGRYHAGTMESESEKSQNRQPQDIGPAVVVPAYHQSLLNYLKKDEAELWQWFSSHCVRTEGAETVRLELLKTAYRIGRDTAAELYSLVDVAVDGMGLSCPVTVYQAQNATGLNASLAWLPHEAHVVFHGPVQESLTNDELLALLVHELAHHELL